MDEVERLALQNALFSNHVFAGGELVKIARLEPYDPETVAGR